MRIERNFSLRPYLTFGIDVRAEYFVRVSSTQDLIQILDNKGFEKLPRLILGGGSNLIFTSDYPGIVIQMVSKGWQVVRQDEDSVWVRAAAGENWHTFVSQIVAKGWGGVENLALIPGTCGAAPIQNIGAYGVELADTLDCVEVLDTHSFAIKTLSNKDCELGYRESVFKSTAKGRYVILFITLKLSKKPLPNTSYSALAQYITSKGWDVNLRSVYQAVIEVRQSKLPNPEVLGNCGSFFKNPIVQISDFERLKSEYPQIPYFPAAEGTVKIPAGWLIEQCGWKGKQIGNVACYSKQALVLVNATGKATGKEVVEFAQAIAHSVWQRFAITLTPEVNII